MMASEPWMAFHTLPHGLGQVRSFGRAPGRSSTRSCLAGQAAAPAARSLDAALASDAVVACGVAPAAAEVKRAKAERQAHRPLNLPRARLSGGEITASKATRAGPRQSWPRLCSNSRALWLLCLRHHLCVPPRARAQGAAPHNMMIASGYPACPDPSHGERRSFSAWGGQRQWRAQGCAARGAAQRAPQERRRAATSSTREQGMALPQPGDGACRDGVLLLAAGIQLARTINDRRARAARRRLGVVGQQRLLAQRPPPGRGPLGAPAGRARAAAALRHAGRADLVGGAGGRRRARGQRPHRRRGGHDDQLAGVCCGALDDAWDRSCRACGRSTRGGRRGAALATCTSQGKQICFDFTKGLCTRGDKCKYSHDLATIVHVNSREKGEIPRAPCTWPAAGPLPPQHARR